MLEKYKKLGKVCLCVNDSCPKRELCYRFKHKGNANYSYNDFQFYYKDGFPLCKHFLTLKEGADRDA